MSSSEEGQKIVIGIRVENVMHSINFNLKGITPEMKEEVLDTIVAKIVKMQERGIPEAKPTKRRIGRKKERTG